MCWRDTIKTTRKAPCSTEKQNKFKAVMGNALNGEVARSSTEKYFDINLIPPAVEHHFILPSAQTSGRTTSRLPIRR
jgi:hypothetical protein